MKSYDFTTLTERMFASHSGCGGITQGIYLSMGRRAVNIKLDRPAHHYTTLTTSDTIRHRS